MNDKHLIQKIQSDLNKSNTKIINNNDNTSVIQKNFSSKYTEDISDSEDEDLKEIFDDVERRPRSGTEETISALSSPSMSPVNYPEYA